MKTPIHANHHVQHRFPSEVRFCALCGGFMERRPVLPDRTEHPVCEKCGFVFFASPKLIAGCIIVRDNRVLLLKRGNEPALGKWTFPGGFVDFRERAIDAAIRETAEEVGLSAKVERLHGVYTHTSNHNAQVIVYLATAKAGETRPSNEATEIRYFAQDEIPWDALAFPSTVDALTDWTRMVSAI
jgi:8-oxo-dGTP diphosphatase